MLMEWSDALVIGIPEIDEQHKTLLDILNKLNAQILHGHSEEAVERALQKMRDYSVLHFEREEGLMAETGFPGLERHARLHKAFVDKLDEFAAARQGTEAPEAARRVLSFLLDWLVDHILGADVVFARFYQRSRS